jgi:hypothetical protein
MSTLKLSDGKYRAIMEMFWALNVFADQSKSGYEASSFKMKITSVSSSAQVTDDLIAIEIMSAPKVKGMLYSDSDIFSFCVKEGSDDWMIVVDAKVLLKMVEETHAKKEFCSKPEMYKLMAVDTGQIFGFLPISEIIDEAIVAFKVSK